MNRREAAAAMSKAQAALTAAWKAEPSPSRRGRLRSVILRLEREMRINASVVQGSYEPAAGNFVMAAKDLNWIRNRAVSFAIPPEQQAQVMAWAASVLKRF